MNWKFAKGLFLLLTAVCMQLSGATTEQLQDTLAKLEAEKELIESYIQLNTQGEIVFVPVAGVAQPAFVPVKKALLQDGIRLANVLGENSLENAERKFPDLVAYSNKMILKLQDKLQAIDTQTTAIKKQLQNRSQESEARSQNGTLRAKEGSPFLSYSDS